MAKVNSKTNGKSVLAVGNKVFIRTVTLYYTGEIVALNGDCITLKDAAWIADAGRWADALKNGTLNEVEPYPGLVDVLRGGVIDVSEWKHALPREQK